MSECCIVLTSLKCVFFTLFNHIFFHRHFLVSEQREIHRTNDWADMIQTELMPYYFKRATRCNVKLLVTGGSVESLSITKRSRVKTLFVTFN